MNYKKNVQGNLTLKVDTGAAGYTLPLRTYNKCLVTSYQNKSCHQPVQPVYKLTSYSWHDITCLGSTYLNLNKEGDKPSFHLFYCVDVNGPAILGLKSNEILGLIKLDQSVTESKKSNVSINTVNKNQLNSIEDLKRNYLECFDRIGEFHGEVDLHVKTGPRKIPIIHI